jgi:opacity protein-like surface antigen
MKHLFSTLVCLGMSLSGIFAQGASEPRARVDVGGGASLLGIDGASGNETQQGLGVTLGVLFKNGFLLRFNVSKADLKHTDQFDFGLGSGLEVVQFREKVVIGDASAGYLWNRSGMIRPYLRGGFAFVYYDLSIRAELSGSGSNSDVDEVLTYGGGVEVGEKNHMIAFDLQKITEARFNLSGLEAKFDATRLGLEYRFRF